MKKPIFTFLAAFVLIALGFAILLSDSIFSIEHIEITGFSNLGQKSLQMSYLHGEDLLSLDTEALRKIILLNPRIENVVIHKILPNRLRIEIIEKKVAYLLNCGEIWGITKLGDALPPEYFKQLPNLPIIKVIEDYQPRPYQKVMAPSVQRAMVFLKQIEMQNVSFLDEISEIISDKDGECSVILRSGGITVRFPINKSLRLDELSAILQNLGNEKCNVVEIDLRFSGRGIVRFQQSTKSSSEVRREEENENG